MADGEFPAPSEAFVLTHFLVVEDQERSRAFYRDVMGAAVVLERDPAILQFANSWLILNEGGGPTDDKPGVTLEPPPREDRTRACTNIRVADVQAVYEVWSAKGATFLTPPIQREAEIRCDIRDLDGHLIEVGQLTANLG